MTGALVDPDWLRQRLRSGRPQDRSIAVFDASASMPGESFDPRAAFRSAHIPGARFLDLEAFSDPETDLPHTVPSAGRFARLAGALGVGNDTTIVLYDSRHLFSSPRAWFLFRLFGVETVHVLDGGLRAWLAHGGETASGEPPDPAPRHFVPHPRLSMLAGLGDVERLASGDGVILDARSPARFEGSAPEPRPGIRSGHIPGSRNVPFGALLEPDGRFRPPDQLRALFASHGVTHPRAVVTSCGSGVTAAVLTLGLHLAGLRDTRLFDGSWTEYALAHPEPG